MAVNFPPYYTSQILNSNGKPVAGGLIRAYLTGTETPAPLFSPDGTPLGSSVSIDAAGNAVFCLRVGTTYRLRCIDADGAVVWTRDGVRALGETAGIENPMTGAGDMIVGAAGGEPARLAPGAEGDALKIVSGVPTWSTDEEGMQNPMTAAGDLIVGTTGGEPARLGVGTDGDILATASGAPTWEGGPKKYRNVYGNIPSPQIDDGYLGCLFYLSGSAQALTLPSSANIPSKAFIDFVFLDGTATLTITPQGTTTLNEQAAAVTIGGQAATLYRLTFLGHGVSGDEWALGGSGNGDHKVMVDGADSTPGYLLDKLTDGDNAHFSKSGNAVKLDADNDKVAADNTDSAPGFLIDKLYPGDGVAIEAVTDGAVRKVKVSATGGGGGGGIVYWEPAPVICSASLTSGSKVYAVSAPGALLPEKIKSFSVIPTANPYSVSTFNLWVAIYDADETGRPLISSFTWDASKHPSTDWSYRLASFNFDATISIDPAKMYRCTMFFNGVSSWGVPAQAQGSYFLWGNVNYSGGANTQPLPNYTQYTGWTGVSIVPWFRLNSFSV